MKAIKLTKKPILSIKQNCTRCIGSGVLNKYSSAINCLDCKGSGTQPQNIYDLRDFEKCEFCYFGELVEHADDIPSRQELSGEPCLKCNGTGYKIPFKDYEIKTIEDLHGNDLITEKDWEKLEQFEEDEKIVIKRELC